MCVLHGLWVDCFHSELKGTPTRREYFESVGGEDCPNEIWTGSVESATIHKIKCSSAFFLQSSILTFQMSDRSHYRLFFFFQHNLSSRSSVHFSFCDTVPAHSDKSVCCNRIINAEVARKSISISCKERRCDGVLSMFVYSQGILKA